MKKILCLILAMLMISVPVCAVTDTSLKFDLDLSGTAISDKSGNNLAVTNKNISGFESETIGTNTIPYVEFTGNALLNFNISGDTVIGLDNMTIETWVKPRITDANGRVLFAISTNKKSNATFYAEFTDENLVVSVNGSSVTIPVKNETDETKDFMDEWVHYVFTRSYTSDGKVTVNVYINGTNVKSEAFTATKNDSTKKLYFGALGNLASQSDYYFKGGISEARVYDKVCTDDEVTANFKEQGVKYGLVQPEPDEPDESETPVDPDLLLSADFSAFDGTAASLKDKAKNVTLDITGTLAAQTYTGLNGKTFKYAVMDKDSESYISVKPENAVNAVTKNPQTTVEMWVKVDGYDTNGSDWFLVKEPSSANAFGNANTYWVMEYGTSGILYNGALNFGNVNRTLSEIEESPSNWNHYALTRDVVTDESTGEMTVSVKTYVNGKLLMSADNKTAKTTLDSDTAVMYFGGSNMTRNLMDGGITGMKVHKKILSADEIKTAYETQGIEMGLFDEAEEPDPDEPDTPVVPDDPDNPFVPDETGLILDVDFSNFTGTAATLKDKTGNASLAVTNVTADTFKAADGTTVKYAKFTKDKESHISVKPGSAKCSITKNLKTTVEMWLKIDAFDKYGADYFLVKEPSSTGFNGETTYWAVEQSSGGILYHRALNSANTDNTVSKLNEWKHYVFTRDIAEGADGKYTVSFKAYVNGTELMSAADKEAGSALDSDTAIMYFGGSNMTNNLMDGGIASIKVYNKILSDDEVKTAYDETAGSFIIPQFTFEAETIYKDDSSISVLPVSPLVTDDVIKSGITLTENNSIIAVKDVTKTDDTKFVVNLSQYLDFGQKIKVWSEALQTFSNFTVFKGNTEVTAAVTNGTETIDKPDGSAALSVMLTIKNNGSAPQNYKYFIAARNSRNASLSSHTATASLGAGGSKSVAVSLSNTASAKSICVYVWKAGTTTLTPVYGVPIIFE